MYPDKNMLEQLKNLSVYAKQLKEISSFLQQTPNFYDTVKQYQNFADDIQKKILNNKYKHWNNSKVFLEPMKKK